MKTVLAADRFDNDRTPAQLRRSFANSHATCIAYLDGKIMGTGRVLSDGVCNAYLVDLWTLSALRRRGVARRMVKILSTRLRGQHIYLQADDDLAGFYRKLGFGCLGCGTRWFGDRSFSSCGALRFGERRRPACRRRRLAADRVIV